MQRSLAILFALTGTASANTIAAEIATGAPSTEQPRQVDGRVGMLLGGADVGDADGWSVGFAGGLGYRIGEVSLRGTFDYFRVGDGSDETLHRTGRTSRLGGAARYSFANTGYDNEVALDFWGEAGVGYQHVEWRDGGVLDRPDVELAVGFDLGGRGDVHQGKRREVGYYMAFRTLLAEAPQQVGAMATCSGPCDQATTPSRIDITMFADFGVHFGH